MKRCFVCGETKPIDEFYRHPQMADGHLGKCKDCAKRDVRQNRAARADYYSAYDMERQQRPERRAAAKESHVRSRAADPERYREYGRKWARDNPDQVRLARAKYVQAYPERAAARNAVGNAVRAGRLKKQPCEVCGAEKAEGHHDDYSKPLDVRWLCKEHHAIADQKRRQREGGVNAA